MAKTAPDSRTPRRFSAIRISAASAPIQASCPSMKGKTDLAFWTPEEIDTATVRT